MFGMGMRLATYPVQFQKRKYRIKISYYAKFVKIVLIELKYRRVAKSFEVVSWRGIEAGM